MATSFYATHLRHRADVGPASYLRLFDQGGLAWYLQTTSAGLATMTQVEPRTGRALHLDERWHFYEFLSSTLARWFLTPVDLGGGVGSLLVAAQRPAIGQGVYRPLVMSDGLTGLWLWEISPAGVLTPVDYGVYVNGSHTILRCRRCQWIGHVDRSNAWRNRQGHPQFDRCPRDGTPFMSPMGVNS